MHFHKSGSHLHKSGSQLHKSASNDIFFLFFFKILASDLINMPQFSAMGGLTNAVTVSAVVSLKIPAFVSFFNCFEGQGAR